MKSQATDKEKDENFFDVERGALYGCWGNDLDIVIPSNVRSILNFAFSDSKIESLTIPKNVKKMGEHAFSGCSELKKCYN